MAELTKRERAFGRTALVMESMMEGLAMLKSSIQLADDETLTESDIAAYQNLADHLGQFARKGLVGFLQYCVEEGLTPPDGVGDLL